jgi:hypothetical protein
MEREKAQRVSSSLQKEIEKKEKCESMKLICN